MLEALLGGALGGLGGYFGAKEQADQAANAANMSEMAKAWTQLLGMGMLDKAAPDFQQGMAEFLKIMGGASNTLGQLPGVAAKGQQAQLGQVAGAERGAISQVNRSNQQAMGGIGQSAASKGFYGSSIQGGQSNQMQANTNQSIADIMAGAAGQKSNIIGQGTSNQMQGLIGAAQGQQAYAGAKQAQTQANYNLTTDKINMLLATANQFGIDQGAMLDLMNKNPQFAGLLAPYDSPTGMSQGGSGGSNNWGNAFGLLGGGNTQNWGNAWGLF